MLSAELHSLMMVAKNELIKLTDVLLGAEPEVDLI